ncbi:MAG: sodium:solute symporter family protein [Candidatus Krumholzibacteriota bacterium]|nr:sodium:solute symporter family protein [Candidatus Krumholzibacteriota bacterium]
METGIVVIAVYLAAVVAIGLAARTRWRSGPEEYFLAGRTLGGLVFLGTMAATNFSAFTVFGASGAGYRDGYAFFPIVGFGTGFMALSFWVVGRKIHLIGRERGLVTPAELVSFLYGSRPLAGLFALVMIVFTVPYIALQPMAGGYVLRELFGIPHAAGAALVTVAIVLYVLRGGLRAVAWTDVFQGLLMVGLLVAAFVTVAGRLGGFERIHASLRDAHPALLSRPGGEGRFTPEIWLSYLLLWFLCDPMFPQLFQRFYAARDVAAIRRAMLWYPAVCTGVFFLPVALGVMGRLAVPGLEGAAADQILPAMLGPLCGETMAALIMTAGLAALMSTMDSQLLTLGSIFGRDVWPLVSRSPGAGESMAGRIFVPVLAAAGLLFAVDPPGTILAIATQAFTGLAVLFPTVLFGLYLEQPSAPAAILSIIAGEAVVFLAMAGIVPTGGFLPVFPAVAAAAGVYAAVALAASRRIRLRAPVSRRNAAFGAAFALLLALAVDRWWWNSSRPSLGGFPAWLWFFLLLSGVQTALMAVWTRRSGHTTGDRGCLRRPAGVE